MFFYFVFWEWSFVYKLLRYIIESEVLYIYYKGILLFLELLREYI